MRIKVLILIIILTLPIYKCGDKKTPLTTPHEKLNFGKYYSTTTLNITPQVPSYELPLQTDKIYNFNNFLNKIKLTDKALKLLQQNGFVVVNNPFNPREENITEVYEILKDREIPIFITSDSLLHLYHIQFGETLRQIEEKEFYDKLWQISKILLDDSIKKYNATSGDLKEASKRNTAYFTVGLKLLQPTEKQLCRDEWRCQDPSIKSAYFTEEELKKYKFTPPDFVKEKVKKELELIQTHQGFAESPIFIYIEDYSQYIPRGHYTRSEKLKNYFKAMMWFSRMSMLLKGTEDIPKGKTDPTHPDAFISTYDARIQTIQAALIANKIDEDKELQNNWDRIYSITAFYVGTADDLGPYQYIDALNFVFHKKININELNKKENVTKLKLKLAEYQPPRIYGGLGRCEILPPFTEQQANKCLHNTTGFRLIGQRFIPDSYIFSNLVGIYTSKYLGNKEAFTTIQSPMGPIRGFPRGLDVMALLSSKRAKELLKELDDSNYKNYDKAYNKLEDEFAKFTTREWTKNLYFAWLYALKPLLKEFTSGYPTFMQTTAWQDKALTTALASWTELRHDTILYAKQSYTKVPTSLPPPEKPVVGYIEPVPEFYNRLLSLTRMTTKGLEEMQVLDNLAKKRLDKLEKILKKLVELSIKELNNEELTLSDYEFIKNFGKELNYVIEDVADESKKTTIIADVHTDPNTDQVLEEAVGYVKLIIVAYYVPDGRILIGAGPVMTYYEFKQPLQNRLTNKAWREMLNFNPPKEPEWIYNFTAE